MSFEVHLLEASLTDERLQHTLEASGEFS